MRLPRASDLAGLTWVKPVLIVAAVVLGVLALKSFAGDIKEAIFGNPEVKKAQAETTVQRELTQGLETASTQGMEVVVRVRQEHEAINQLTQRNDHAIKQSQGADQAAPDVARSLHDALCLRDAYRGSPGCPPVQEAPGR